MKVFVSYKLYTIAWATTPVTLYLYVISQINAISSHKTYFSFKWTFPTAVLTMAAFQEHMNHPGSRDPIMLLYLSMCIQVQSSCRGSKISHLGFATSAPLVPVQVVRWVTYIAYISGRQPTDTHACRQRYSQCCTLIAPQKWCTRREQRPFQNVHRYICTL